MCKTWIIESTDFYSNYESEVLRNEIIKSKDSVEELDPKEAMTEMKKGNLPDIILIDNILPWFKSIFLIEKLKKINPCIKVLVLASDRRNGSTRELIDKNIPILQKPFLKSEFLETVTQMYKDVAAEN